MPTAEDYNKNWDTDYSLAEPGREFPMVIKFKRHGVEALIEMQKHGEEETRLTLEQCDPDRFHLNRVNRGQGDWATREIEAIRIASVLNMHEEAEALRSRGREKEASRLEFLGPQNPWKKAKHGPIVEIVLSAHHKYFLKRTPDGGYVLDENGKPVRDLEKGRAFLDRARDVLFDTFGERIVHAREDRDEMADHAHVYIIDWTETRTKTKGVQRMITPTKHPLLKSWEKAQTELAKPFEDLGLIRARDIARQRREAEMTGARKPEKPLASDTYIWRQQQKKAALEAKRLAEIAAEKRRNDERKAKVEEERIERMARSERQRLETITAGAKKQAAAMKAEIEAERKAAKKEREEAEHCIRIAAKKEARIVRVWKQVRAKGRTVRDQQEKLNVSAELLTKITKWITPIIGQEVARRMTEKLSTVTKGKAASAAGPTIPGSFLVSEGEDAKALLKRMSSMTNARLRTAAIVTRDAAIFVEEKKEQADAVRGWKTLMFEAKLRGLDVETGKQDLSKAKDPKRAALHTDQPLEPLLEIREEIIRGYSR